jgi:hypothetical protein
MTSIFFPERLHMKEIDYKKTTNETKIKQINICFFGVISTSQIFSGS